MEIWNGIALIKDDTHFTPWVKEAGRLDHHQALLARALPHLHGTVVEVGANIGTHTVFYAKHADRVIAFEPLADAFQCLHYNTAGLNVELILAAAGKDFGSATMVTPEKNYGASFTILDGGCVPVAPIDSLELDACDFLKIDAEGDEIDVLIGAEKTIERFRPTMLIEINRSTLERKGLTAEFLLSVIRSFGYEIEGNDNSICCDVICTHAAAL